MTSQGFLTTALGQAALISVAAMLAFAVSQTELPAGGPSDVAAIGTPMVELA